MIIMDDNHFIKNDVKKKNKSLWTHEQENLLAEWAEKAACYRWLHAKSEKIYTTSHYRYSIPIIILSTLTGTANFGIESVPKEYTRYAQMAIGGVNLFAGIMGTLQNFFRYAELMEAHRNVEILWSKFQREISVELALDPKRRKGADEFLAVSRSQFDKLIEQSPPIPDKIIKLFKSTFKKTTNIHKPDICNGIDPCNIYKPTQEEKIGNVLAFASNKFKDKINIPKPIKVERMRTQFDNARKNLTTQLELKNLVKNNTTNVKNNIFKQVDNKVKDSVMDSKKNLLDDIKNNTVKVNDLGDISNIELEPESDNIIIDKDVESDNIIIDKDVGSDNIIDKDVENP